MPHVDDLLAQLAAPLLCEDFAEAILVTERGSDTPATVWAIVNEESTEVQVTDEGVIRRRIREICIPRTSVAAGGRACLANPSILATYTHDEIDYAVERIVDQCESWTRLRLIRPEVTERSRKGYRVR